MVAGSSAASSSRVRAASVSTARQVTVIVNRSPTKTALRSTRRQHRSASTAVASATASLTAVSSTAASASVASTAVSPTAGCATGSAADATVSASPISQAPPDESIVRVMVSVNAFSRSIPPRRTVH